VVVAAHPGFDSDSGSARRSLVALSSEMISLFVLTVGRALGAGGGTGGVEETVDACMVEE
jgi:hypothetical protein